MSKELLFWIIYLICFLFGGWWGFTGDNRRYVWPGLIVFILVGLLGWAVFGAPIK